MEWERLATLKRHIYLTNYNRYKHMEKWKAVMKALLAIVLNALGRFQ